MNKPKIVYEVWSRSEGKLDDQLVSLFWSRDSALDGVAMYQQNSPGYEYFIREYKNPGV